MKALRVLAGPGALAQLREQGLRPQDVAVIPGAAGGPKGLVLNRLDRHLFAKWLPSCGRTVHLVGASIGAWRMAAACMDDPDAALARLADDYVHADYASVAGARPSAEHLSSEFHRTLLAHFQGHEARVLGHPRYRLHVVASRGRQLLSQDGRWRTPLGYLSAFAANLVARRALGGWLERVLFSDRRDPLPLRLNDYRTRRVALNADNLIAAVLASCSIPFWMRAVHDIPGAPRGPYWDGGITDYHLHWPYSSLGDGLALYPHFQASVVPGWLDKSLRYRHRSTAALDKLVVLAPSPEWVASLPGGKLPDRSDLNTWARDVPARQAAWARAVAEGQRLADEFANLVEAGRSIQAEPL